MTGEKTGETSLLELETDKEPYLCNAAQVLATENVGDEAQATKSNLCSNKGKTVR